MKKNITKSFKKLIVANWKMNPVDGKTALLWFKKIQRVAHTYKKNVETVICPPSVYLQSLQSAVSDRSCVLGAQNCFYENSGSYTGEISTDSSAFQFWNEGGSKNADLLAKGIRLTGGNPAKGKILISVDNDGRAVWATPKLAANGKDIIFDTTTSPVGSCTTPTPNPNPTCPAGTTGTPPNCVPIVTDLCNNIDGIQTTLPDDNLIEMPDGSCQCDVGTLNTTTGKCTLPTQNSCYRVKSNCTGNPPRPTGSISNNCGLLETSSSCASGDPQQIEKWSCSGTPTTSGSAVTATPVSCSTSNQQPVAYRCHAIGSRGAWELASARGYDVTCTSMYIPQLPSTGQSYFTEGDIVCTITPPSNSLCSSTGVSMSGCTISDTTCPN